MKRFLSQNRKAIYTLLVFVMLITSCGPAPISESATVTPAQIATETISPTSTAPVLETPIPPTPSFTATSIPTATATPSPTPLPIPLQPINEENAAGLQQWYTIQGGAFRSTDWAPDGKSLWIVGGRSLDRYDTLSHSRLEHQEFAYNLNGIAVSKGGSYLALLGGLGNLNILTLWNVEKQQEIHRWEDTANIQHFSFSSDESRFVYLSRANARDPVQITVWDLLQDKLAYSLQLSTRAHYLNKMARVAISPDDQFMAVSYQNRVTFWSLDTGKLMEELRPDAYAEVEDLAFSKDSSYMIVSTNLGNVYLLDRKTGQFTRKLIGPFADIPSPIMFSPDGRYVVAMVGSQFINVWDLNSDSDKSASIPRSTFEALDRYFYDASYSPDGTLIAVTTSAYRVYLVDSQSLNRKGLIASVGGIASMAVSTDSQYLAYGGGGGPDVHIWSFSTQKEVTALPCSKLDVGKLYFPKTGNQLVSTCGDGKIIFWSMEDLKNANEWQANGKLYEAGITDDGKLVALVDGSGPQVFQTESKKYLLLEGKGQDGSYSHPAISPDGSSAAFVWTNNRNSSRVEIRMWDTNSRKRTKTISGFIPTSNMIFSPDGKYIAAGTRGNLLSVWSAANGNLTFSRPGHTEEIAVIAFSPNGSLIASTDAGGVLRIWSMTTGQSVAVIQGQYAVRSLAFTPDGNLLLVGGTDGTISVWGILP